MSDGFVTDEETVRKARRNRQSETESLKISMRRGWESKLTAFLELESAVRSSVELS
jgi:hypothetical protein